MFIILRRHSYMLIRRSEILLVEGVMSLLGDFRSVHARADRRSSFWVPSRTFKFRLARAIFGRDEEGPGLRHNFELR